MPDAGADEIDAFDDFLDLRNLAARYADAGLPRAFRKALAQLVKYFPVGGGAGDVVHHADRFCADADDVVDVHSDAVDSDGVVFSHQFGDDDFRPHAVGAKGNALAVSKVDDIGEVADVRRQRIAFVVFPGWQNMVEEASKSAFGSTAVDPAFGVMGGFR